MTRMSQTSGVRRLAKVLLLALAVSAASVACEPFTATSTSTTTPTSTTQSAPTVALLDRATDIDGQPIGAMSGDEKATIAIVFASWCGHCRNEMRELAVLRSDRSDVRYLGINYVQHEEYDGRGNSVAVRAMRDDLAPWLRVIPAGEMLWAQLGSPTKVPTIYIFDRHGVLAKTYDRRFDALPTFDELERVIASLP